MGTIHQDNIIVPMKKVVPNNYNPKPDYKANPKLLAEFDKIKKSLREHGQMDPIQVREVDGDKYEIINGYHRFLAMQEEGFKDIEVKNLGKITRGEAIAKTLTFEELKIPLDYIEVAKLLQEPDVPFDMLPYTQEEVDDKISLLNFDFDSLEQTPADDEGAPIIKEDRVNLVIECIDDLQKEDIENNIRILLKRKGLESAAQTLQIVLQELVTQDDNAFTE